MWPHSGSVRIDLRDVARLLSGPSRTLQRAHLRDRGHVGVATVRVARADDAENVEVDLLKAGRALPLDSLANGYNVC